MNIYSVIRLDEVDYDEYYGFVCVAETAADARRLHPSEDTDVILRDGKWQYITHEGNLTNWNIASYEDWPTEVERLSVKKIGTADASLKPRVILSSYKAG